MSVALSFMLNMVSAILQCQVCVQGEFNCKRLSIDAEAVLDFLPKEILFPEKPSLTPLCAGGVW